MVPSAVAAARLVGWPAGEDPASYMVFDLLAVDGVDFAASAVAERRAVLDTVAAGCRPPLQVLPFTDDPAIAAEWFADYPAATGVEGLSRKGPARRIGRECVAGSW
jgi:ATP-dependent DNA ligase